MSLIEQAAKRLDELRRAGADVLEHKTVPSGAGSRADAMPTPDALVARLEAAGSRGSPSSRGSVDTMPATEVTERLKPSAGRPAARLDRASGPRFVELDLARLASSGFMVGSAATSQLGDEYRVIKRPIIRNATGRGGTKVKDGNLVMVTSALPGEGKTFTALNLALSVAMELDHTVLLVDGDVAHPSLPGILGVPSTPGLLDLLTRDDLDVGDVLIRTNVEKLAVIPAGAQQRRATELLASEQMAALLRELATRYPDRIIIFDSPPLLATTEARVLATHMGQIVMVVGADSTTAHAVSQGLAAVEGCDVVLLLLNRASRTDVGTYYGYYQDTEAR